MFSNLKCQLRKIKHLIVAITQKKGCIIHNVCKLQESQAPRVLICYLDYTIFGSVNNVRCKHSNEIEFNIIINYFSTRGYIVDVCSWDCDLLFSFNVKNKYSIIFGFGNSFKKAKLLCPYAKSIIYMTENPYWYSYIKEKERLEYLYNRRNVRLSLQRTGWYYKKDDEKNCDAILCMGKKEYFLDNRKPIRQIFPTALSNENFVIKKTQRSQKNFLALGSAGFVHKGYDILIDVFEKHPDWILYLAGYNNLNDILQKLGMTLPPNVIDCGFIDISSNSCLEIMNKCASIVQFSCSEANSTSILTGMRFGLVPIVSRGSGSDLYSEYCFFADGYSEKEIEATMLKFVETDDSSVKQLSNSIKIYADDMFNTQKFEKEISAALDELIKAVNEKNY